MRTDISRAPDEERPSLMMRRALRATAIVTFGFGLLCLARPSDATSVTVGLGSIDDQAGIFSRAAIASAQQAIADIEERHNTDVYVRTATTIISNIADDARAEYTRRGVHGYELYVVPSQQADIVLSDAAGDATAQDAVIQKAFEDTISTKGADAALLSAVSAADGNTGAPEVPAGERLASRMPSWTVYLIPLALLAPILGFLVRQQQNKRAFAAAVRGVPVPDEPEDEEDHTWVDGSAIRPIGTRLVAVAHTAAHVDVPVDVGFGNTREAAAEPSLEDEREREPASVIGDVTTATGER
jgi:hypothetical protein